MNACSSFLTITALVLWFCGAPLLSAEESASRSASAAILAVPVRYTDGIIQVVGNNGAPWPSSWVIYARDADEGGTTMQLTFSDGQFVKESASLRPSAMFQESATILQEVLPVDADSAFAIAHKTAQAYEASMTAANYELVRRGPDEAPRWVVQCLDEKGKTLGTVEILCTDGTVLSTKGFR